MAVVFDEINKIILIEAPQTEISCQELYNECKDFEYLFNGMDNPQVVVCTGKQNLKADGSKKVGLTLELLDNWRVQFEDRAVWTTCRITDGNFVPSYQSGLFPIVEATKVFVIVELDTSAAVVTGEGVGEDWSDAEKANIRDALGVAGTKTTATGGQLQDLQASVDALQSGQDLTALEIARILGLAGENQRIKDQVYDGIGNMTSATLRIYGNAADCNNDTNPIAEYAITATYSARECTSYKMVKQ